MLPPTNDERQIIRTFWTRAKDIAPVQLHRVRRGLTSQRGLFFDLRSTGNEELSDKQISKLYDLGFELRKSLHYYVEAFVDEYNEEGQALDITFLSKGIVVPIDWKRWAPYAVTAAAACLVIAPAIYQSQMSQPRYGVEPKALYVPNSMWDRFTKATGLYPPDKGSPHGDLTKIVEPHQFEGPTVAASEDDYDKLAAEIKDLRRLIESNHGGAKLDKIQLSAILSRLDHLEKEQKKNQKQQEEFFAKVDLSKSAKKP